VEAKQNTMEIVARMPDLTCTASGQVSITVANATGTTTFLNGPTFPRPLTITSTTSNSPNGAAEDLTINLRNFRPNCTFSVTLESSSLPPGPPITPQVLSTTADSIVVRVRRPGPMGAYILKMQTTYGVATKVITLGAQSGSVGTDWQRQESQFATDASRVLWGLAS
jgi:hypothetical protein